MMDALNTHKMQNEVRTKIKQWLSYVRATVVGEKKRATHSTVPINIYTASEIEIEAFVEDMLIIEIPVRELSTIAETQEWYQRNIGGFSMKSLDRMVRSKHNEEYLRMEHPGLQESWEQYQIMLKLCARESYS